MERPGSARIVVRRASGVRRRVCRTTRAGACRCGSSVPRVRGDLRGEAVDTSWIVWSSLFSLIGMAVFVYGRRQGRAAPLISGVALMVYPYFVSSTFALIGIGVALLAGMFVGSRWEEGG